MRGSRDDWLDLSHQVRLREPLGDQQFEFDLGLVRGRSQQVVGIVWRQIRRQHHDATQMQPAFSNQCVEGRDPPGGAGDTDALVRHVDGHVMHVHAEREHRRIAFTQIQPARIDLTDFAKHPGRGAAIGTNRRGEILKQGAVGDVAKRVAIHGSLTGMDERGR